MKHFSDISLKEILNQKLENGEIDIQNQNDLEERIENIKKFCNIPKRYINAKYGVFSQKHDRVWETLKKSFHGKSMDDMNDVLIYGNIGTGKTYISCAFLNEVIKYGIYCRYSTEYELLELYFQKRYNEFESFKKADILVIDELAKRELQDWQRIQIEELLSYRYMQCLPTIFITNKNEEEFKKSLGARVCDRLRDNKILRASLEGESLRGKEINALR